MYFNHTDFFFPESLHFSKSRKDKKKIVYLLPLVSVLSTEAKSTLKSILIA